MTTRRQSQLLGAIAFAILVLAVLLVGGCATPLPPPVTPDGPPPTCDQVCAHVHDELGCMSGDCLRICERILRPGYRFCAAAARSCSAVTDCGRPRR